MVVVSSGIEPESRASETLILSIVLRDLWACDTALSRVCKTTWNIAFWQENPLIPFRSVIPLKKNNGPTAFYLFEQTYCSTPTWVILQHRGYFLQHVPDFPPFSHIPATDPSVADAKPVFPIICVSFTALRVISWIQCTMPSHSGQGHCGRMWKTLPRSSIPIRSLADYPSWFLYLIGKQTERASIFHSVFPRY